MQIGVVVPCFNEAARWDEDYWTMLCAIDGVSWLFVDDGSTDLTPQVVDEFCFSYPHCEVLHLASNGGKSLAVQLGLRRLLQSGGSDVVAFMDADGAFAPQEFDRFRQVVETRLLSEQWDAVWSARVALAGRDIRRTLSRHYLGRIVATFVSLGGGEIPYDTQSGLKFFRVCDELSDCLATRFSTRWLFDVEFLSRWSECAHRPMRIWEEPLMSWTEVGGSRLRGKEVLRVIRELAVIKRQQMSK